ncbi:uncharacterized protein LOC111395236 [Olea europaea var. sylvestris]|uniref:uncharacterized protein LOC111395236 n=1 Tax=Olea europaea var. sylvestris TaxID=158386 RepID=UPI000C1D1C29|nr:uncharacterized protein LOC111395236 [Olea europaea var. sylvestris]
MNSIKQACARIVMPRFKVQTANFLIAKHSRNLLCHACQLPSLWTGSNPRLRRKVSLSDSCSSRSNWNNTDGDHDLEIVDFEDEDYDDDKDKEEEEEEHNNEEDDDIANNQVVPSSSTCLPPPLASSSFSSEESFTG